MPTWRRWWCQTWFPPRLSAMQRSTYSYESAFKVSLSASIRRRVFQFGCEWERGRKTPVKEFHGPFSLDRFLFIGQDQHCLPPLECSGLPLSSGRSWWPWKFMMTREPTLLIKRRKREKDIKIPSSTSSWNSESLINSSSSESKRERAKLLVKKNELYDWFWHDLN